MAGKKGNAAPQGVNYFVELAEAFRGLLESTLQLQGEVAAVARSCAEFRESAAGLKYRLSVYDDKGGFPEKGDERTVYVSRAGGIYLWDSEKCVYYVCTQEQA